MDAGLVMRYFGSKQDLYRRVIDVAPVREVRGTPAESTEQILAALAEPAEQTTPAALPALWRWMLTNPEAASAASAGIARYEAQNSVAITADDGDLQFVIMSASTIGITVSPARHQVRLKSAPHDPGQIWRLLM